MRRLGGSSTIPWGHLDETPGRKETLAERDHQSSDGTTSSPITLAAKRYETVFEAAGGYTRQGARVTPLNGKKPILNGWPSKSLDEDDLSPHFADSQNVGVLLGKPSGG